MPAARNFRARAEPAPPDLPTARRLLDQADRHLASAGIAGVEGARSIRNGIEYHAREVTQLEVAELGTAAHELVAAARRFVDDAF